MTGLMATLSTAASPLLWLEDTVYVERLLGAGRTPWLDSAEYVAFRRKAQGLLRADLTAVPLVHVMQAWVAAHPALAAAMSAKRRTTFPLRTLMADEGLSAYLVEMVGGLRAAFPTAPLVLGMPSPRAMITAAWQMAFGADVDDAIDDDDIDTCAVHMAAFLRSFGDCKVDGVLLTAAADGVEALELYPPLLNIATHYRWDVGVHLPSGAVLEGDTSVLQCVVAPQAVEGVLSVASLPETFWDGVMPAAADTGTPTHHFATIPADAVPENVLARLAALRGA